MTLFLDCIACQVGDHDNHREVVQSVPSGVLGGAVCRCNGECCNDREQRLERFRKRMGLDALDRLGENS